MATPILRRSFITFHLTLGLTLLILSAHTVVQALAPGAGQANLHIAAIGTLEGLGALLFLFPGSLRVGGALLLLTIGLVIGLHAVAGQFRGDLLVYAAGTWFVMAHGSAWHPPAPGLAA